ncbi:MULTISPECIES: hypothetical protein [Desulfosediminicola]|uniref:hypothetical protein n=1 Tax=Desulfosediminicola TaxID=2886823 RepID=UPI0010AC654D|nr:hypothetical protein [Desulfosediminicola ganghwensis]
MEDITQVLAFQVKKDMAERYFGFRKRIETDTINYKQMVTQSAVQLENNLGTSLVRIYILLQRRELITEFIHLIGLKTPPYYEPYTVESPTIKKRVFQGLNYRGLTQKRAYKNMLYDSYCQLYEYASDYLETFRNLQEEHETIQEEIAHFYRNNDIDTILQFLRRLDLYSDEHSSSQQYQQTPSNYQKLSDQIKLRPPLPPGELLPTFPPLPPPKSIRKKLDKLIDKAIPYEKPFNLRMLTREVG